MVLPLGLSATLVTLPPVTVSGASPSRFREAASHSTTPPSSPTPRSYPAAMVLPPGPKATLVTPPSATLSGASPSDFRESASHSATPPPRPLRPAYPTAMVLPSGLSATLVTLPPVTVSGASPSRFREPASHSTTPPSLLPLSYLAAMVLPLGLSATLVTPLLTCKNDRICGRDWRAWNRLLRASKVLAVVTASAASRRDRSSRLPRSDTDR